MSRGPGRLQRAILVVLDGESKRRFRRHYGYEDGEWTTEDICSALHEEWWWDDTFTRQARRALDRLHATGRVDKRLAPNRKYSAQRPSFGSDELYEAWVQRHPQPTVAFWRLPD